MYIQFCLLISQVDFYIVARSISSEEKEKAIDELEKTLRSIVERRILHNHEVIPFITKYLKWLFTHVERPYFAHVQCENLLERLMTLLWDDHHQDGRLSMFQNSGGVESILKATISYILTRYK
jgi:hypothetical protein